MGKKGGMKLLNRSGVCVATSTACCACWAIVAIALAIGLGVPYGMRLHADSVVDCGPLRVLKAGKCIEMCPARTYKIKQEQCEEAWNRGYWFLLPTETPIACQRKCDCTPGCVGIHVEKWTTGTSRIDYQGDLAYACTIKYDWQSNRDTWADGRSQGTCYVAVE